LFLFCDDPITTIISIIIITTHLTKTIKTTTKTKQEERAELPKRIRAYATFNGHVYVSEINSSVTGGDLWKGNPWPG